MRKGGKGKEDARRRKKNKAGRTAMGIRDRYEP